MSNWSSSFFIKAIHLLFMKKITLLLFIFLASVQLQAQFSGCEKYTVFDTNSNPDLGIVIYSDDAETVWNALRLAIYAQSQGDTVVVFLLGKGLDGYQKKEENFDIVGLREQYFQNGGQTIACGTCAKQRGTEEVPLCTISSIRDFYMIIKRSKKTISF